jgi:Flp pilus assembly protein TadG
MRRNRLITDSNGQSLMELAFTLPLLAVLLFGTAEFGRLCYVGIEVTNAAHAAATYGSQNRATASDNSGMTTAATNDGTNLTNLQVTPQHLCAATYSDTPTTDCTTTTAIEYVQVNTQVTVASLFHSYGFGGNYTLHGQAIERVRQ